MSETIIQISVKICSECPYLKITNRSTIDGFDYGEEWKCMKENKVIAGFVEWHEKDTIEIPEWCPFKQITE